MRLMTSPCRPANSHGFTLSLMISVQVHGLTATQANLTGSSLRHVNIYKCHSNGASDTDFISQGAKMQPGVGKGCRILLSCRRRLHTKSCAHKLCKRHRLVLRLFLTWNRRSSCGGHIRVENNSIGATLNRQPSLKAFGLAQLAELALIS